MNDPVVVAAAVLGERARRDDPLGSRTTYRVGGAARLAVTVESERDLELVSRAVRASGIAVLVVGNGSNLLVADAGFDGLAIWLGEWAAAIDIDGSTVVAGSAASLPVLARRSAAAGLTGLEWAVGVPGTVGGAVRMNAGGHGSDMASSAVGVRVYDLATGEDVGMAASELGFEFRRSRLADHHVVVSATFQLRSGDRSASETELAEIVRWRREHQPGGQNAGSVFVNPLPEAAGALVDATGLRGLRIGSAEVSTKHANFIQADEGGSADDVVRLMATVRDRVEARTGVRLRSEIRLVGFDPQVMDRQGSAR